MKNRQFTPWWKALAVLLQVFSVIILISVFVTAYTGKITEREIERVLAGESPVDYIDSELFAGTMYEDLQRAIQLTWYERIFESDGKLDMDRRILKIINEDQVVETIVLKDVLLAQVGGGYGITSDFQEDSSVQVVWFPLTNLPTEDPLNAKIIAENPVSMTREDIGNIIKNAVHQYIEIKRDLKENEHNVYFAFVGNVMADNGKKPEEIVRLPRYYRSKWIAYRNAFEEGGNVEVIDLSGCNPYFGTMLETTTFDMMTKDGDRMYIGVDTEFAAEDHYSVQKKQWQMEQNVIWFLIYATPVAVVVWLLTMVYLIYAVGRRPYRVTEEENRKQIIRLNPFDKKLVEVVILGTIGLRVVELFLLLEVPIHNRWIEILALVLFLSMDLLMGIAIIIHLVKKAREKARLVQVVERIAEGQMEEEVDLSHYTGMEHQMAEHISQIRVGMENAVDSAMKNERLKTELISNVSHDIKTPLTSIINYSDLLKRVLEDEVLIELAGQPEKQERIRGYLEVLEQKGKRLKVLIEDLVEASKASSGVLQISAERINLVELIFQVNGEFEEKFAERNLKLIMKSSEESSYVLADGRRVWRILENLYQNVYKYAMSGTRVYVEIQTDSDQGIINIKNISAEPISVSPEDLTERFVRGDSSRSTEGCGLGLAIAQSLTNLQKGSFQVNVDGDLFRVSVGLPLWQE